jgi:ribosome-associated protein
MTVQNIDSFQLSRLAVDGILEKKGKEIVVLDLRKIGGAISDFFVICHGTSRTQVEALAESVDMHIKKLTGQNPLHVEGTRNAEWILIDYSDVVVHVFTEEVRHFFKLEDLWADARREDVPEDGIVKKS